MGSWEGTRGAATPAFSPEQDPEQGSSARIWTCRFFDEAVCGVRWAGHVQRTAYCAAKGVSAETETLSGVRVLAVLFPIQTTTNGGFPNTTSRIYLGPIAFIVVVTSLSSAAALPNAFQGWTRPGGRCASRLEPSQRRLSLSSRDDPNYKDIMRLRAQLADTL